MKRQYVESRKDVSDKAVEDFIKAVEALRAKMLPVDSDSDEVVDILFVDRRKFEKLHYYPVPYHNSPKDDVKRIEEAILDNLDIALERMRLFREIRKIDERIVEKENEDNIHKS